MLPGLRSTDAARAWASQLSSSCTLHVVHMFGFGTSSVGHDIHTVAAAEAVAGPFTADNRLPILGCGWVLFLQVLGPASLTLSLYRPLQLILVKQLCCLSLSRRVVSVCNMMLAMQHVAIRQPGVHGPPVVSQRAAELPLQMQAAAGSCCPLPFNSSYRYHETSFRQRQPHFNASTAASWPPAEVICSSWCCPSPSSHRFTFRLIQTVFKHLMKVMSQTPEPWIEKGHSRGVTPGCSSGRCGGPKRRISM